MNVSNEGGVLAESCGQKGDETKIQQSFMWRQNLIGSKKREKKDLKHGELFSHRSTGTIDYLPVIEWVSSAVQAVGTP